MSEMEKKKIIDFIIITLIILMIIGVGFFAFVARFEGGQCLEDPLGYAESLLPEYTCSCSCMGAGPNGLPVWITSNGNYSHINRNKSLE